MALPFCLLLPGNSSAELPAPVPDAVWQYITKISPYTEWSFWPDHQGMQKGNAPHGPYHKVYVNTPALQSAGPPVQYGSMLVKENYSKRKVLTDITLMFKVAGYNPRAGDWFWAKYSPTGEARLFGKVRGCIGCHGGGTDSDYILTHQFK